MLYFYWEWLFLIWLSSVYTCISKSWLLSLTCMFWKSYWGLNMWTYLRAETRPPRIPLFYCLSVLLFPSWCWFYIVRSSFAYYSFIDFLFDYLPIIFFLIDYYYITLIKILIIAIFISLFITHSSKRWTIIKKYFFLKG